MLKNKIIVRKIRNIIILIMAMIVMVGAYRNIGRSRAEDVIEIEALALDNYGYLQDETFILEAKEIENDLFEIELPESINTKKINEIVKITLGDPKTQVENETEKEGIEIIENKIYISRDEIETKQLNIEMVYDVAVITKDEQGVTNKNLLKEIPEDVREEIEITEETEVLYSKVLRYEDEENGKLVELKGYLPKDARLQVTAVTQEQINEIFGDKAKINVAYDIKIIMDVVTIIPADEADPTAEPEEIIETVEINPEDLGETCEVSIKDVNIQEQSKVYHVKEDNTYETVTVKENTEENITFEAQTFSIYAVGTDEGIMATSDGNIAFSPESNSTYAKSHTVSLTINPDYICDSANWISSGGLVRPATISWSGMYGTCTTPSTSGSWRLVCDIEDRNGTPETVESGYFYVDVTAPVISGYRGYYDSDTSKTYTSGDWVNEKVGFYFGSTSNTYDSHSGIAKYQYSSDGSTWYTFGTAGRYQSFVFYDRIVSNYYRVVDAVGNVSNVVPSSGKFYCKYDTIAPTAGTMAFNLGSATGSTYTLNNWTNQDVYLTLTNGEDTGNETASLNSGHKSTTYTVNGTASTATSLTENGTYSIVVTTEDNAENTSSNTYESVKIDKTKPTITVSPTSKTWTNTGVSTTITVADTGGSGLLSSNSYQYYLSTSSSALSGGSWTTYTSGTAFTLNPGTSGTYYLFVKRVKDNAGNTSTANGTATTISSTTYQRFGSYQFDYDKPTITVSPTGSSSNWYNAAVSTTITVSETGGSGLSSSNSYQYYLSNSSTALSGGSWTTYTSGTAFDLNPGTSGTYYLFVKRVSDNAGNTSTTNGTATTVSSTTYQRFGTYLFDYDAPTISVSPTSKTWTNTGVSTTITVADTGGSGLLSSNSYQYYLSTSSSALSGGSWTTYTSGTAFTLNPGTSGTYYLFVKRVKDNAGNTSTANGTATTISSTTYQRFGSYQFDYDKPTITVSNQVISDGLIRNYNGYKNTSSGHSSSATTWTDLSGTNDGTLTGGTWGDDYLELDGTDDGVNLGEVSITDAVTVETTIQLDTVAVNQVILANYETGGFGIEISASGKIGFYVYSTSSARYLGATTSEALTAGTKYHIMGVFDGSSIKMYIDGTLAMENTSFPVGTYGAPGKNTVLALGANPEGASFTDKYFDGKIYSVRVYNRALRASEVSHNYEVDNTIYNWHNSAVSTTITVSETGGSGLSSSNSYQYYLSNSSTALSGGSWTTYTSGTAFDLNPGTSGTYYLFVKRVSDNAGNTSTTNGTATTVSSTIYQRFGTYLFDYDKPSGNVSASVYYTNQDSVTIYMTDVSDTGGSGVKYLRISAWYGTWSETNNNTLRKSMTWDSTNNRYYVTYTFDEIPNAASNEVGQGEGKYRFNGFVEDNAGNIFNTDPDAIVIYDTTEPTISVSPEEHSWTNTAVSTTITVEDPTTNASDGNVAGLSDDNSYQYYLSNSSTALSEGEWTDYTSGTPIELNPGIDGEYYLFVKVIEDNATNMSTTNGTATTISSTTYQMFGPYQFDYTSPAIEYSHQTTDVDQLNKIYEMTFTVTDEHYASGELTIDDLTILMQNGQLDADGDPIVYDLKEEPVTLALRAEEIVEDDVTLGHTYTLTISNLEQLEIKTGLTTADYSGIITVAVAGGKIVDLAGNTNEPTTITTGVDIPGGSGTGVPIDVVDPLWIKVSSSVDLENGTATLTIKGTDTYFNEELLDPDEIIVFLNGTQVTSGIDVYTNLDEVLYETRLVNGTNMEVPYGVKHTITVTNIEEDIEQMKIRIPSGMLIDESGNVNKTTDFTLFNYLRWTGLETGMASPFLGNSNIKREDIEKVKFVTGVSGANSTQWDASAVGDNSIIAWYTDADSNGAYEVFIGSDDAIFANKDSSYLFAYIGYGENCTATTTIENLNLLTTINVENMRAMFWFTGYRSMTSLNLGAFYTKNVTNMREMFNGCGYNAMTTFNLGTKFDTSNVTDMSWMFANLGYKAMTSLTLPDEFTPSEVLDMSYMFSHCGYTVMTTLTLPESFDTSQVETMEYMFRSTGYTAMTELILPESFNTGSAENMEAMFAYCGYTAMTEIDLGPLFNTSYVENMESMFAYCGYTALEELYLGEMFNTSNVTNMRAMFEECGGTAMWILDLGPAFTKITGYDPGTFENCGSPDWCAIYVPESIYMNRDELKEGSSSTDSRQELDMPSNNNAILIPLYKPEWSVTGTTVTNTGTTQKIDITLSGGTDTNIYTSYVTTNLTADDITVYIDGTELTEIEKSLTQPDDTTVIATATHTLTLTNFEEALRQAGKLYKEWSGNITLKIGGRGQNTDTYTANVLVDSYGNQSMMETDEDGGVWLDVDFKDTTLSTVNTDGKLFADFIKPEIVYTYSATDIDYDAKTVEVVFTIADRYYSTSSTGLTVDDLTIMIDGVIPGDTDGNGTLNEDETLAITRTLSSSDITATVDGATKTIGKQYTLTIKDFEQDEEVTGKKYLDFAGIVTIAIPAGKVEDASGNSNAAETISIGLDRSAATEETKPYLPRGFSYVDGTNLSNGLTIQDEDGNQFVWIEVPRTEDVYETTGLNITAFTDADYENIENDLNNYTSAYGETGYVDEYYEGVGLTEEEYNGLKQKMLKSIYKNGGFYIGKYETGIEDSFRTESGDTTQTPVIKQNAYPYNKVTHIQAQELSESFATIGYTSSLMFGVQRDLILKYLETKGVEQEELDTDSSSWGNYYYNTYSVTNENAKYSTDSCQTWNDAPYEKTSVGTTILTTGAIDDFAKQHIYDLAGNVWTWTLQKSSDTSQPVTIIGGSAYNVGTGGGADRRWHEASSENSDYLIGFRVALYKTEEPIIVDTVDPKWTIEVESGQIKLKAIDEYFKESTLTPDDITIYVEGVENTVLEKDITTIAPVDILDTVDGVENTVVGKEYTLTFPNLDSASGYVEFTPIDAIVGETAKYRADNAGEITIEIAEGTIEDKSGNTNAVAEAEVGNFDVTKLEVFPVQATNDTSAKTETIIFNITDKNYDKTDLIGLDTDNDGDIDDINDELTIKVDGVEVDGANIQSLTYVEIKTTVDGVEKVVGHQYTLVLNEFAETDAEFIASEKDYRELSGTVSIEIAATAAKDTNGNNIDPTTTTVTGDFIDYINPDIVYEHSTTDIDTTNNKYTMTFSIFDKYYTSGVLSLTDLTILMTNGQRDESGNEKIYNLQTELPSGSVRLTPTAITKDVNATNTSGVVEAVTGHPIGHTYTLEISNLDQIVREDGDTTVNYSGVITVAIAADKVKDRNDQGNAAKTITSGVNITGDTTSGTPVEVDVVDPIWEKVSSSALAKLPADEINATATTGTATITIQGTDTYLDVTDTDNSTLTSDEIEVYVDGEKNDSITPTITKTDTVLEETRNIFGSTSGETETVQYGVEYTITVSGWAQGANQVKIKVLADAIKDETGNGNEATEFIIYNCLESSLAESEETSGFLDGNGVGETAATTGIARNEIQQVVFVENLDDAPITVAADGTITLGTNCWDVSAISDKSILAWTEQTEAPYTVYVGSNSEIFANQDSTYLFSYIGFAGKDTDGDGTIEESETYYTATATDTISNIGALNVSSVIYMKDMFQYTGYTKMTTLDLGDRFNTSNVRDMRYMFEYCGYTAMTTLNLGTNFNTSNVTDMSSMFYCCGYTAMTSLDLSSGTAATNTTQFDTSKVVAMNYMFSHCGYTAMTTLNLGTNFNTSDVDDMWCMFRYCGYTAMTSLDLSSGTDATNTTQFNTSNVTMRMAKMFYGCGYKAMTSLNLGNNFDTSNVTDMSEMFAYCGYTAMTSLDLSSGKPATNTTQFNTSSVTDMNKMFYYCGYTAMTSLNLGTNFNTSNVTNMRNMFYGCGFSALTTLDLSSGTAATNTTQFNTSNVTNMNGMFTGCGYTAMTSLNLGNNFDTSSVTNMRMMFNATGKTLMTSLDLGDKFDTTNVENMYKMFYVCGQVSMTSLDLGPAFTNIPDGVVADGPVVNGVTQEAGAHDGLLYNVGKENACTIYVPESIYSSKTSLKLNSTSTTTIDCETVDTDTGTVLGTRGTTIIPKYKPEWSVTGTTVTNTTTEQKIDIVLNGAVNTSNYTSNVTTALTADDITVWIDGTQLTDVGKSLTTADPSTGASVTHTLTLTNFEEALRQSGKLYKEWSGNISLKIAGRGEETSTYSANVLVDEYGNQSMSEIDTTGTWIEIELKDATTTAWNTNGKLFADFIKPEYTYEYAETEINKDTNTLTVVFYVADKYFDINMSVGLVLSDFYNPEEDASSDGKAIFQIAGEEININVEGNSLTSEELEDGTGLKHTLVVKNLEQNNADGFTDGYTYSGVVTISIPKDRFQDHSGNKSDAKTFTIGIDDPTPTNETIPYLPTGFSYVEGNLNTGIVIQDGDGNQYVWIEVPRNTTVYDEIGLDIDLDSLTGTELTTAYNNIMTELEEYTERYDSDYLDWWDEVYKNGFETEDEYYDLKRTMLKSVYQQGGFYIGRYETGTATARTDVLDALTTPVIQANKYPYNYVSTTQAHTLASQMAPTGYTSDLMFNLQWDLVLKYLENKGVPQEELDGQSSGCIDWGNYYSNKWYVNNNNASTWDSSSGWVDVWPGQKVSEGATLLTTGATSDFSKQNIYDLAGNVSEITLGYSNYSGAGGITRGGNFSYTYHMYPSAIDGPTAWVNGSVENGFRVALYAEEEQELFTVENAVKVDVVDPIWELGSVDLEEGIIKLKAKDKYFSSVTIDEDDITVYIDVNGTKVEATGVVKDITSTTPTEIKETVDGVADTVVGYEYTLLLSNIAPSEVTYTTFVPSNLDELDEETQSTYEYKYKTEYGGDISIEIGAGTIHDVTGNTNRVTPFEIGNIDITTPAVYEVRDTVDSSEKTETIVFNVTDKNYDKTDLIGIDSDNDGDIDDLNDELTIKIDGIEITDDITIESLTYKEIKTTVDGVDDIVVGHQYTLVLKEFVETDAEFIASGREYRDLSGTVSIEIAPTAARDITGNTLDTTTTTIVGDFVDFINPDIRYEHSTSDIDTTNNKYTMTFSVFDKYHASGILSLTDLTILMTNGQRDESGNEKIYNLQTELPSGSVRLTPVSIRVNTNVTNESTGVVETVTNHPIGHLYTLEISNLDQLVREDGDTTVNYSGVITVAIVADKVLDRTSNGNLAKTITSGVNITGDTTSGTPVEVDLVDPIWERVSSSALAKQSTDEVDSTATTGTATITIQGTDTYLDVTDTDNSTLTSDEIEVYIDGTKNTTLTPTITRTATVLEETRNIFGSTSGETEIVQYGVEYTITVSGWAQGANQVKIKVLADAIKDETGNGNKDTDIIAYNVLKKTDEEDDDDTIANSVTYPFLGSASSIQRQNIENVTFLSSTKTAPASGWWDVSAQCDNSIIAWATQTTDQETRGVYTVYIASDYEIFANQDSTSLFIGIGYSTNCTATETITGLNLLNTSSVTNMKRMLAYCGYNAMTSFVLPGTFDTSNVTIMTSMFSRCGFTAMMTLTLPESFDTSNVLEMGYMFRCTGYTAMTSLILPDAFNTSKTTEMSAMFYECGHMAMTELDLGSNFDTTNVLTMNNMFNGCGTTALTTFSLGTKFNTSNVKWMNGMFREFAHNLETLDLGDLFYIRNIDDGIYVDMNYMFAGCGKTAMKTLDLGEHFNTSKVQNMYAMFLDFAKDSTAMTSLDLGNVFYTTAATDMSDMFNGCGATAMTSLDLGPAFTKIATTNTDFVTNTGKSGECTIYAPESIYKSRTSFKLNSTDTTNAISYSRGTINPIYRPEWSVTGTTITNTTTEQKIDIVLNGTVNTSNYTSDVTTALTADDITVWIDGTQLTDVGKSLTTADPSTGASVTHTLTLTNFEESVRRSGLKYTEWSGNISLKIAGRGEETSTYSANVLVDEYGNQSMMETDENQADGTWIDIELKDAETSTSNTNGKLFADFIKPEYTYEYAETEINKDTNTLTVVFYVADKFFDATNSVGLALSDFYDPDTDASSDGKAIFQIAGEEININVAGNSLTSETLADGTGLKYTLVVKNLEQNNADGFTDGYTYSGEVTISIPKEKFQDKSGNKSDAKTFTIGIDEPTTGDGHTTAVKVDVVDPIWELGDVDLEEGIIKLKAKDKYFNLVTIDEDDISVYVNGNLDGDTNRNGVLDNGETSKIVKDITSTTPTDIKETVDGVANTVVGKEYTLLLSNIVPDEASDIEFVPTNLEELDAETRDTYVYKYKSENGGTISIKIAAGTITDVTGNASRLTPFEIGNIDGTSPGIYEVRKTQNSAGNTETIVFNVTDKNFDSSDLITKTEMSLYIDNVENDELLQNATFEEPKEIKTTVDGVENVVVGHQYTLVISNIAESTKQTGKDYLEWSGTLKLVIDAEAAQDITGNKTSSKTITDFIDYLKPQLEQVTVANPISTSAKTYTMSFNVIDKYLDITDLIGTDTDSDGDIDSLNNELTIKVDGEDATDDITWQLTYTPITAIMNKTVEGAVVSNTYTIGHTYTLVLSGFEQGTKHAGKDFFEWSGTVSVEIAGTAVKDTTGNNLASNPTILAGEHVDFIKPKLEEVEPTATIIAEDATNKTETIVFNIMDKYLDTTNALETTEFTVYVDGEAVTVDYTNASSTGLNGVFTKVQDFKHTVNEDEDHIVGRQYKLVLSNFEQATRNSNEYKDFSGTVSIEITTSNAVNDTSNNLLDSTNKTVTGDFVDYIKPDIEYTHQDSDVDTGNKKYIMTFDITDKYYSLGELTLEDIVPTDGSEPKIEILMQNGQLDASGNPIVYNLKDEPVTLALASTPITKSFNKTVSGAVVTGGTYTIGHTYTLTISNLEQLEMKTGMTTADYSGIITVSIDGDMITDTSNNGNPATTITAGVDIEGGVYSGTEIEVDVVDPLWKKVSSSALAKQSTDAVNATATTGTSTITIRGTDTYLDVTDNTNSYDDSTLTTDEIEVYIDGVKNDSITPTITSTTPLTETRRVYNSATTETVQYGVEYTMTISGWAQAAKQVKIKILADAIKDETGNGNKATEFIIYNCLESSASETAETSGFLDGNGVGETAPTTGIKRKEIQQVIFVENLDDAPITVAGDGTITLGTNCWDVSAISDKSILAWTSQTEAPYTVYIGSDSEMFANQDASYLFAYIGFAGKDTDEDGTIEESETYYTATATETISNIGALNVSSVTNMNNMFRYMGYSAMESLNLGSDFDPSNVTKMTSMFTYCGHENMTTLNLGTQFDTRNVQYMDYMFAYCGEKEMTELDLSSGTNSSNTTQFNTSNVKNMLSMFDACGTNKMETLNLGTNFDTRNVLTMERMFRRCGYTAMTGLDLSSGLQSTNTTQFNTSSVTDMSGMFQYCGFTAMINLNLGTNFDTSGVTDMDCMFGACGYTAMTSLDLSSGTDSSNTTQFNTSSVTNMAQMFAMCGVKKMVSLNLGHNFDTSNVENMKAMFNGCGNEKLTSLDLGDKFDTSSVTNMYRMFSRCGELSMTTLDLGPAFTHIPDGTASDAGLDEEGNDIPAGLHENMFLQCGTSALIIYAPESIYSDRTGFKLNN